MTRSTGSKPSGRATAAPSGSGCRISRGGPGTGWSGSAVQGWENDQACRLAHLGDRQDLTAMIDAITERASPTDGPEQPGVAVPGLTVAEVALRGLSPVGSPTTGAVGSPTAGSPARPVAPYRADGRSLTPPLPGGLPGSPE